MTYLTKIESFFDEVINTLYPVRQGRREAIEIVPTSELAKNLSSILDQNIEPITNSDAVVKDFTNELPRIKKN